jgi:hypothetical protein
VRSHHKHQANKHGKEAFEVSLSIILDLTRIAITQRARTTEKLSTRLPSFSLGYFQVDSLSGLMSSLSWYCLSVTSKVMAEVAFESFKRNL